MYNLMDELNKLYEKLQTERDHQGVQTVSQAIVRIHNLEYDVNMYKRALLNK